MNIDIEKLTNFIEEAHRNTYANKKAKKAKSSKLNSKDYVFKKGPFKYHDTYFGDRNFMGQEIVYFNGSPIWGMNYCGYITDKDISKKEVFSFLRDSLMQKTETFLFRGPEQYTNEKYKYINSSDGDMNNFYGTETILNESGEIYRSFYNGGIIN